MYINNNTNRITGCHYLMGSFVGPGIIKKKHLEIVNYPGILLLDFLFYFIFVK